MSSITAFQGSVPENYERYLGPLFFEPYAIDLVQRLADNSYLNILELACGTGRVTRHLLQKLAGNGTLFATDLNADMLRIAQEKVQDDRVIWSVADAHELPFGNESMEAAVCQYGVMFFADKPKALLEVLRILQRGGRFYFNTWDNVRQNAVAYLTETVLQETFPAGPPTFFEKGPYSFYNPESIQQLLVDAGFTNIEIELVPKLSVASSPDDVIRGILDGTPLFPYLEDYPKEKIQVQEKLRERLLQHYGHKDLSLPMQAFVCSAAKPG